MIIYKEKEYNKYDFFLITLVVLQLFGLYGGAFQPIRLFSIFLIPLLLFNRFFISGVKKLKFIFLFAFITWLYAFITLLWVKNFDEGLKNVVYLFINLLILIEFIFLAYLAKDVYFSIWKAWFLFILLTIPIAYFELIFDKHLSVSFIESETLIGATGVLKRFASVTFGNYNLYNFILAASLPILMSILIKPNYKISFWLNFFLWFVIMSIFLIIISNGSRGALLSVIFCFLLFIFYLVKKNIKNKVVVLRIFSAVLCFFVVLIYYVFHSNIFFYILFRLQSSGYDDNVRSELFIAGLKMLTETKFFGVGSGNFMDNLNITDYYGNPLPPHNLFVEIFSQYGILVFILFLFFLLKIYGKYKSKVIEVRFILIVSALTLIINFVINSGYLATSYMWIYFASLYSLSRMCKKV